MKILVISHTYITPINRDKWKVLAQKYHLLSLKVVFPTQWPTHLFTHTAPTNSTTKENSSNCEFIPLEAFNVGNEVRYGYYPQALIKLLKSFRPDIIHVEQGDNAFSYFQVILFARLLRLKAQFSFFTWINWEPKTSLKYKIFWKWIEKFNLTNSHGAIAGNHDAQKILEKKGFASLITVLPQLGINHTLFKPATKSTPQNLTQYIGYIGRITEEKGVLLLAKAFSMLYKKFPEWNLLFVGTGPFEKQLIDFTIQHKLVNRIEFRDPVPHEKVASVLQLIDILVLPSYDTLLWKEQFGHILIEAMACKIPIIASSGGEIPHVVADTGLIFPQKNEPELIASLYNLMSNEALRKELGEKGYKRSKATYAHDIIAEKTYFFWKQLIATK